MGKIMVYIYEGMADFEIILLTHLLSTGCGKEIIAISDSEELLHSKSGMLYKPHKTLQQVNSDDFEGLIIPGGWLENLEDELINLILKFDAEKKLIAAICAAPWILAKAGILVKRKYTTSIATWEKKHKDFFCIDDPFPRQGYVEKRVVRDDHIITAKGAAFIDFAIELCDYFSFFKDEFEKKEFEKDIKSL